MQEVQTKFLYKIHTDLPTVMLLNIGGQEEKGTTEDEMVGWHHRHNGHVFGLTPGVGHGQEGLACCGSWGHKESDTTERLN